MIPIKPNQVSPILWYNYRINKFMLVEEGMRILYLRLPNTQHRDTLVLTAGVIVTSTRDTSFFVDTFGSYPSFKYTTARDRASLEY